MLTGSEGKTPALTAGFRTDNNNQNLDILRDTLRWGVRPLLEHVCQQSKVMHPHCPS